MSGIISFIVAAIFALWGYQKRLYPAWAFIFNVLIATYLGMMLTPAIMNLTQGGPIQILGDWQKTVIVSFIFIFYLGLSQLLSHYYLTNTFAISFPKWIDELGGALLAFIGGYIMTNMLLFALSSSPLKNNSLLANVIPTNEGQTIRKVCNFISSFSVQDQTDENIAKMIEKFKSMAMSAQQNQPKTQPQKNEPNRPVPAQKILPDNNKKIDTNDQSEKIKSRSEKIVDSNTARQTNQPVTIDLKDVKTIPADNNKISDTNTNTQPAEPAKIIEPPKNSPIQPQPNRFRHNSLQNPLK